ncbi:hypothetical protein JMJ78_0008799 [Colletotrichum scovillei]|nr:hypothetical protein JMJ78_0008799 [Colletotrichum scovillei]
MSNFVNVDDERCTRSSGAGAVPVLCLQQQHGAGYKRGETNGQDGDAADGDGDVLQTAAATAAAGTGRGGGGFGIDGDKGRGGHEDNIAVGGGRRKGRLDLAKKGEGEKKRKETHWSSEETQ